MNARQPTLPPQPPRAWGVRLLLLGMVVLAVASFVEVGVDWGRLFSVDAAQKMGRFLGEMAQPAMEPAFLARLGIATLETLAMSAVGTLLAAVFGLLLALPASRLPGQTAGLWRAPTRWLLNVLRSIPELVWAALLLISAGLGPLAGTLALALHTTGVLGRLFAEVIENAPDGPAFALRVQGVPGGRAFLYATFPLALPQLLSYTLYRWENNIRAAAVLGVVGGGGLGQMLSYHMGLFHMRETGGILLATILLVALVDLLSTVARKVLNP
ncbi:phosphonate ABC transporter, permease protein PhnE [Hydrogenophaga sp.]|uniref:phosphonate ABC transporter, permease protein PhnE n=1 Tax=Hydrogenophaga sp. TaxID=1904254 RepID=UPI00260C98B6|nr:phosphonate ABC transporter, permease protein PhnE [Hydrogenophaga sp.]MCW5653617.1 phosphonate ABC transporter, permease protein PhnE [Hydrogenophaga sp.]